MVSGHLLKIDMDEHNHKLIMQTLERDIEFLKKQGLMDFSLLVGIEKVTVEGESNTSQEEPDFGELPTKSQKSKKDTSHITNTGMNVSINQSLEQNTSLMSNGVKGLRSISVDLSKSKVESNTSKNSYNSSLQKDSILVTA